MGRVTRMQKWVDGYVRAEGERAQMADLLSPVVFWCRFCRVTLEPFAHA